MRENIIIRTRTYQSSIDGIVIDVVPTSKVRVLERNVTNDQEPADAHAVVRRRPFQQCFQRRKTKRLPDQLREGRVGAVRQCVDDSDEEEKVSLRV